MKVLVLFIALFAALGTLAQSPCTSVTMPPGTVCLSQEAANASARIARESAAKDDKIAVLEAVLIEKDRIIADNKMAAAKNEADLRAAMHKTETELATKTGQLIATEGNNVRNLAIIDVLLKGQKKKCMPFSVCLF